MPDLAFFARESIDENSPLAREVSRDMILLNTGKRFMVEETLSYLDSERWPLDKWDHWTVEKMWEVKTQLAQMLKLNWDRDRAAFEVNSEHGEVKILWQDHDGYSYYIIAPPGAPRPSGTEEAVGGYVIQGTYSGPSTDDLFSATRHAAEEAVLKLWPSAR